MRHSKDSIDRYFESHLHLETRTLYLGSAEVNLEHEKESGTDAMMAEWAIKALHLLSIGPKAEEPITIQMANIGGDWNHGMAIYDAIRACPGKVSIQAYGPCMSMGAVILQAAEERLLLPNTEIMIHDGESGYTGHARNFEKWAMNSKKIRQKMYQIFSERSNKSVSYWSKKCAFDFILTAQEAVEEGLADKVLKPAKKFK